MHGHTENSHDHVLERFHSHPISFFAFYLAGAIFVVLGFWFVRPLIWVGFMIIALGEVSRLSETFYVFESGVAREYRLFTTSRKFIEYDKIQNLGVSQSIVGNIFDIGTVSFDTAGGDRTEVFFYGIKHPYKIEELVREKMAHR